MQVYMSKSLYYKTIPNSPEVLRHGVLADGVIQTNLYVSIAVQTQGLHLVSHLCLTGHSKGYLTNKLFGYLDHPGGGREGRGRGGGGRGYSNREERSCTRM